MDRKTYRRYLKTKRWQKLRFEVLKRSKGKCERCGYEPWKPNGLQVHHLTSSGISYSPQELLYLAKKAGNNQADARLLHDYAKSHGYELKNYVSPDQKIEKFHKMNETFGKFADDEGGKDWFRLPDAEIDIFVGNQLSSVEIMPENMEIRTVAKSIDEEISRDIAENEKKKAENADKDGEFLNGFGVDPEEPDTNFYKPEDDATENVSPEEESENVDQ